MGSNPTRTANFPQKETTMRYDLGSEWQTYHFGSAQARAEYRDGLPASGVTYDVKESEEVIAGITLYALHIKRTSPTLKQLLTKGATK